MTDFFECAQPVFDLYEQGRYAEALRVTDALALEFPDRAVNTSYWRMCLLAVSGHKEKALQVMEEALTNGLWWSEERLRNEPDVKDLQGNPEFERLVSICAQRHEAAKGRAKPELAILEPDVSQHIPLLMLFHGRDGNADREKRHWELARDLGWLTVFVQSSQAGSLDAYVWDDVELAHREIADHFKALQQKYPLDPSRTVLGGFSQGSGIAILTALRGEIPATAFIAVAPGHIVDVDELPALAESAGERGLHGVIVSGGKDPRFEMFIQVSETLSKHGVPCQLETRPDLGHAYPSDFNELLEKTLRSLSKEQE